MGNLLVFLEHEQGSLSKSSLSLFSAAKMLRSAWKKDTMIGTCFGQGSEAAASNALDYGFDLCLFSEQSVFDRYLSIPYSLGLLQICKEEGCDVVLGAASSTGKDLFPRVALGLSAGLASDIVEINDDGSLRRFMYSGNVLADMEVCSQCRVVTIRSSAFPAADKKRINGDKREIRLVVETSGKSEVVSFTRSQNGRPDLLSAERIVSGGRGLGSIEDFEGQIFPLADEIGAAIGASRAAVDSGFAPNDWQVGLTGKIVSPELYIGVGISGAVQHLTGIRDAKIIVAINDDEEAPIFKVSDYGLVGNLFDIVPELVKELKGSVETKAVNMD